MRKRALLAGVICLVATNGAQAQKATVSLHCVPQQTQNLATRPSPYDSLKVTIGSQYAMLCYSRPSLKGRKMIGGEAVPYGSLWRTGANEPTIIHIPFAAMIAGVHVEPGSYSIYTVPAAAGDWEIIVNKSITQWGHESRYTDAVKAQEAGRGKAKSEKLNSPVETLTFRSVPAQGGADLILEWETTRVTIPIRPM